MPRPTIVPTAAKPPAEELRPAPRTLAIDIGGTGLKAGILDASGTMVAGPERTDTPRPRGPADVIATLVDLTKPLGSFDRISVGFPGVVRGGRTLTAPNLGTAEWHNYPLAADLTRRLGRPARVLNDATVQGLGVIGGTGVELVITLGTGFGFALFSDGRLGPHLEMGQHPITKDKTYDLYLGDAALKKIGRNKWNKRLRKALEHLDTLVMFDTLLIGGGNARHIDFELPPTARVVPNAAGITGGVKLWSPLLDDVFSAEDRLHRHPPSGITPVPEAAG